MATEVISMAVKNQEEITINVDDIIQHGKELEEARNERR